MYTLPEGVTFFERGWLSANNILIQDADQAILVDTGYWTHAAQTAALVKTSLGERHLTCLFNTHLHSDHCGGNAHLQTVYPELQTFIPPGHAHFVDEWNATALTYTPTGQHCPRFVKTGLLRDGDSFLIAGKCWRIHAAPGHDPHSVLIFNEDDKILISADALWENGFGVVFPEIEGVDAFDEVASTLEIIERLNPGLVLPGHGGAFANVSDALFRARTRLNQFKSAPDKHASYAAKVLLKFKLLELQKATLSEFLAWAQDASYLQLLHTRYAGNQSFEAWHLALCHSLEKAGACALIDVDIVNK
jgi:glyoxylase-like metal-dependent hydrolase (beta-lactamase superfamily II)